MPTTLSLPPSKAGLSVANNGDIRLHGNPLPLPPKESAVLRLLLWQWPERVSKEDFDQQVWHGGMTDEGLARVVANLRRRLHDLRGLCIRSVYGRGYQLFLQASRNDEPHAPAIAMAQHDTLAYARQRIQLGSVASLATARQLIEELMIAAPSFPDAKLAYAECVAGMLASGCEVEPQAIERALSLVDEAHPHLPGPHRADTLRAHLLDCCWRFDEARPLHRLATRNAPEDASCHFNLGWHLLACGEDQAAIAALERALELAPFSLPVTLLLAHTCFISGDASRFAHWVRKAKHDHPENSKALIWELVHQAIIAPHPVLLERARRLLLDEQSWIVACASQVFILTCCGAHDEARQLIADHGTQDRCEQVLLASSLLRLGQGEQALRVVRTAAALGYGHLPIYLRSPTFSALQAFDGYADIHQQVFCKVP